MESSEFEGECAMTTAGTHYRFTLVAASRAAGLDAVPAARAHEQGWRGPAGAHPWPAAAAPRPFREGDRAGVASAHPPARPGA
jgi:hypothetical protein